VLETWKSIEELKARAKSKEFVLPTHAPELETRQATKGILPTLK
jgi:hypothetical protein